MKDQLPPVPEEKRAQPTIERFPGPPLPPVNLEYEAYYSCKGGSDAPFVTTIEINIRINRELGAVGSRHLENAIRAAIAEQVYE